MAFLDVVKPAYADVPDVPGVPSLARLATGAGLGPLVSLADAVGLGSLLQTPQWGIFSEDGAPVLTGDCVAELDYRHDYRVSDAPQEEGAFSSYNKVQMPLEARVVFMVGGTDGARAVFLAQAEAMAAALDLYSVATPEVTYPSVNVTHVSYRRTAENGATLMRVEIGVEEIRVTGSARFTNTASVNGAATQDGGTVQTIPVTSENLPAPV